ncbi:hypothetical protein EI164_16230 [Psychrobacter sp. FME13]|uniref:hypothetical protein n=1 Tax=Psychrobacter sp. FME13 TaxID=2487708 RepID=UPI001787F875|nr:hypothetical protein [Psychrobacter sp. FME13]MBE0443558.1 hypothetical protein [Psychrobacter sp. FME13]
MYTRYLQLFSTVIILTLSIQSKAQPIEPIFDSKFDAYRNVYLDPPSFTNLGPCVEYKYSRYARNKIKFIDTGVRRDDFIEVMDKDLFLERFENSPLYTQLTSDNYYYVNNIELGKINGQLDLLDIGLNKKINKISYRSNSVYARKQYGHELTELDRFGMLETLNLVLDDREKSEEILNTLYSDYSKKVKNDIKLKDTDIYFSYVRFNGLLFELWGRNTTHELEHCRFDMLSSLKIH